MNKEQRYFIKSIFYIACLCMHSTTLTVKKNRSKKQIKHKKRGKAEALQINFQDNNVVNQQEDNSPQKNQIINPIDPALEELQSLISSYIKESLDLDYKYGLFSKLLYTEILRYEAEKRQSLGETPRYKKYIELLNQWNMIQNFIKHIYNSKTTLSEDDINSLNTTILCAYQKNLHRFKEILNLNEKQLPDKEKKQLKVLSTLLVENINEIKSLISVYIQSLPAIKNSFDAKSSFFNRLASRNYLDEHKKRNRESIFTSTNSILSFFKDIKSPGIYPNQLQLYQNCLSKIESSEFFEILYEQGSIVSSDSHTIKINKSQLNSDSYPEANLQSDLFYHKHYIFDQEFHKMLFLISTLKYESAEKIARKAIEELLRSSQLTESPWDYIKEKVFAQKKVSENETEIYIKKVMEAFNQYKSTTKSLIKKLQRIKAIIIREKLIPEEYLQEQKEKQKGFAEKALNFASLAGIGIGAYMLKQYVDKENNLINLAMTKFTDTLDKNKNWFTERGKDIAVGSGLLGYIFPEENENENESGSDSQEGDSQKSNWKKVISTLTGVWSVATFIPKMFLKKDILPKIISSKIGPTAGKVVSSGVPSFITSKTKSLFHQYVPYAKEVSSALSILNPVSMASSLIEKVSNHLVPVQQNILVYFPINYPVDIKNLNDKQKQSFEYDLGDFFLETSMFFHQALNAYKEGPVRVATEFTRDLLLTELCGGIYTKGIKFVQSLLPATSTASKIFSTAKTAARIVS